MQSNLKTVLVAVLMLLPSIVLAQRGSISGTVVEHGTGEPLIGASVSLAGTSRGVATDLDGKYTLQNIEPGTYDLQISYITYTTQIITGVEVKPGEITRIDVALREAVAELSEVVVSAEMILNNESALLRHRQNSISFTDAISAEGMSRSGSGDAASAMTKVTGATVVGGKYVFVRGLGDRYSNTQLNGIELPTSDPDKKSFQLDLFPSYLLENIITHKTFTPDKPGNFSGGLVDVTTRGIPDAFFFTISAKQGYNSQVTGNRLLFGDQGNMDWLAFGAGDRAEPEAVAVRENSDFPSATAARFNPEAASELDAIVQEFNPNFLPGYRNAGMNQSYSIGMGNRHRFGRDVQLGYSANYSYGMNYSGYNNGRNSRFQLLGQFEEAETLTTNLDLTDVRGSQNVDWGFLGSAGLILGSHSKINASFLRTQSGENTGRYLYGEWEQFNSDDIEYRSRVNQYVERDLESVQISGNHTFKSLSDLRIDWNTAFQTNGQEQPDLRMIASEARFLRDATTGEINGTQLGNPNSQFPRPARFFRELNEQKQTYTVDVTLPVQLGERQIKFKTGFLTERTERDFRERRYEYLQGRGFSLTQFTSEEDYLNARGILGFDNANRPEIGNYIISATTPRSSYDAEQDITAYYGMIDMDVLPSLKLATGLRFERTDLQSVSRDTTLIDTDRFGIIQRDDILPSVILIHSIGERIKTRWAYSKTLARPTFREMSPYVSFDFVGDNLFRGNSGLDRTLITNYDFRFEWYPSYSEMVSVSMFYKDMDQPLERVLRFDISQNAESIQNVERGTVYGIEFEMRKQLGSVLPALEHFDLTANYAIIRSEVTIPEAELIQIRETQENPATTRALTGQSPYVLNLDLGYVHPRYAVSANVSYNRFGDRLSRVTIGAAPDVYERGYDSMSMNVSKTIGRHFTLSASATNLLNPRVVYSQRFKGQEYLYQQYRSGRTFSLGVKYSF